MPPKPPQVQSLTAYSQRLIIVVKAAVRQAAEDTAIVADPEGGAGTFVPGTPLRAAGDATNTPVAYWTAWTMTQEQKDRLVAEFGRRAGDFTIYPAGANLPSNRSYWMCDANEGGWAPEGVLAALGYAALASPPMG